MISVKQKNKISFIKASRLIQLLMAFLIVAGLSTSTAFAASTPAASGTTPAAGASTPTPSAPSGFCTDTQGKDTCKDPAESAKCSNNSCDFVGKYVNPTITMLTVVFGLIAAASLIAGGIQFSTSAGDPQKVSQAKGRITNTIIAVIAYLFMFSFLEFLVPGGLFNR